MWEFKRQQSLSFSKVFPILGGALVLQLVACGPLQHPIYDKPGTEKAMLASHAHKLDLHGQTISEIPANKDLSGANLEGAVFSSSLSLKGVNLEGANLESAIYLNGDLSDANLSHADLTDANFGGTLLLNTDLADAILTRAILNLPEPSASPSPSSSVASESENE